MLLRRAGKVDLLSLVSWAALIATGPLLLLSLLIEGPSRIAAGVMHLDWLAAGAILYIAFVSTTFGYGAWGYLLRIYPAAIAAPFSLLVPVFGTLSAALLLGETFGPARLAGMVLILLGLAVVVLPVRWFRFVAAALRLRLAEGRSPSLSSRRCAPKTSSAPPRPASGRRRAASTSTRPVRSSGR